MNQNFQLAACAEMMWQKKPIEWRVEYLNELGFGVGLWHLGNHDIKILESIDANYTIVNGYLEGRLADDEGADMLLKSVSETIEVGKRLSIDRYNLHGTALGEGGIPIWQHDKVSKRMWVKAEDTLNRICDLAEKEVVVCTLENLNFLDHPGCPFASTSDVLTLVSSVNRPELRMNLDLYHTQIGDGDLIRWCEKCLPWIGEVQVADNPGRFEPGTGEINFKAVAKALFDMNYRGPVALEAYAKGNEEEALLAFKEAFTM